MKNTLNRFLLVLTAACIFAGVLPCALAEKSSDKPVVVVIPVKEEIKSNTTALFRRALREAERRHAAAIIIDMDTWGGEVDETKKIMQMLLKIGGKDSDADGLRTFTFINDKAISGGSYIAAATQHIWMAPGSTIGASTAVEVSPFEGLKEMPPDMRNKLMATMRGIMRAAAEENGHRADVFEAMIDPDMELVIDREKIVEKGKLLVLTNVEAEKKYGKPPTPLLSEGTVKSLDELRARVGLSDAEVVEIKLTGFEHLARFLTMISPILILLGMLGIYVELHTPGFGFPGIGAIACFALVFLGNYFAGLAGWEHLALLLLGAVLLGLEIFVVPGFGMTGISGILCIIVALLLMTTERMPGGSWFPNWQELQMPLVKLSLSMAGAMVAAMFLGRFLPQTTLWKRLELSPSAVTVPNKSSASTPSQRVGDIGVAETMLRPAGKARFGDELVDVVTQGDLIDKGQQIKVIETHGSAVVVAKV